MQRRSSQYISSWKRPRNRTGTCFGGYDLAWAAIRRSVQEIKCPREKSCSWKRDRLIFKGGVGLFSVGQDRFFGIIKNGKALVWSQPLILPPRHERLGVREHTRPACRFDQLSSARASVVHRRNEVGFLPARASQSSTSEALHARGTFAEPSSTQARMLLYCVPASAGRAQATPLIRRKEANSLATFRRED